MKTVAFLFSGQGAQKIGMGADWLTLPECRLLFDQADTELGYPISEICLNGPEEKLTETRYCQPALYVHGLASLAALLARVSLKPAFVAGLSLGEFTAHAAAGTFSFAEGLRLVALRGQAMQDACETTPGGMLSLLGASTEQAKDIAAQAGVDVANLNSPGQIVLSGHADKIQAIPELAKKMGVKRAIPLKVAGAYHSKLMEPAKKRLADALAAVAWQTPPVPVVSNFSAEPTTDTNSIQKLLLEQITGSVRWEESVLAMKRMGVSHFIEFGPGEVLAGLMKRIDPDLKVASVSDMLSLEKAVAFAAQEQLCD